MAKNQNIFMRWYYRRWLHAWAGDSKVQGMADVFIKRRFQAEEFFADLYWVIYNRNTNKTTQYYNRVDWTDFVMRVKKLDRDVLKQYAKDCE